MQGALCTEEGTGFPLRDQVGFCEYAAFLSGQGAENKFVVSICACPTSMSWDCPVAVGVSEAERNIEAI